MFLTNFSVSSIDHVLVRDLNFSNRSFSDTGFSGSPLGKSVFLQITSTFSNSTSIVAPHLLGYSRSISGSAINSTRVIKYRISSSQSDAQLYEPRHPSPLNLAIAVQYCQLNL